MLSGCSDSDGSPDAEIATEIDTSAGTRAETVEKIEGEDACKPNDALVWSRVSNQFDTLAGDRGYGCVKT